MYKCLCFFTQKALKNYFTLICFRLILFCFTNLEYGNVYNRNCFEIKIVELKKINIVANRQASSLD